MKKNKEIEYKQKSVIMTSIRSPVRVSGTVSRQDCIFNGEEKEENGDYVKTNVIVAGRFLENFYRCFLISWDNT